MKKIICLLSFILLIGCSGNKVETVVTNTPSPPLITPTITPTKTKPVEQPTIENTSTHSKKATNLICCYQCLSGNINEEFEKNLIIFPSDIYIINNYKNIGFIYLLELLLTEEELNFPYKEDEYGNSYIYYGTLTKIADNIYSSKGTMPSSMDNRQKKISNNIDFYIKFEEDRTYFIFEDLSIDELINYSSDTYIDCKK